MTAKQLTRKGQRTGERIVAAAARLMYEQGVTEATWRRCGSRRASADRRSTTTPRANRRCWRDTLVEYQKLQQCRGGCPIGSLGSEVAENNPEARLAVASSFVKGQGSIEDGLRRMRDCGELRADPDDLALAVLAALQGGLLLTQVQRKVKPLETALDAILDHVESLTRQAKG
ncbi:TetR family transcriptional regulator C-terminal domain-containing protein [Amycolatopsis acidicola]|uniref:LmrA/YxaF family transcription factor n=1 Tax=Amycolatopsis acidicola TaxID=2596893 RepID=UPI001AA047CB|nr:TetR family transcriptional regulator C-terminal domain-containing protein [Amycolatopsis acidicola]